MNGGYFTLMFIQGYLAVHEVILMDNKTICEIFEASKSASDFKNLLCVLRIFA